MRTTDALVQTSKFNVVGVLLRPDIVSNLFVVCGFVSSVGSILF